MPGFDQQVQRALRAARRLWLSIGPAPDRGFAAIRRRFYEGYWHEAAAAVGARLTELGDGYVEARRGESWTLINGGKIALDDHLRVRFSGHKVVVARLLARHGFAAGRSLRFAPWELDKAERFLAEANGPVVVKPDGAASGRFALRGPGAGRGVTCGIRSARALRAAARQASLFGANIVVEAQLEGSAYRLLYLDGRFIDAIRRDPPRLFGDGLSSVRELIQRENGERRHAWPPLAMHPLSMDADCRLALDAQGLSPSSVVPAMKAARAKGACNQNASYDNHVVRDQIHPGLVALGAKLVRALGLRLAGLDLMTRDSGRAPEPGSVFFNEINATPGLHHHWLVAEEGRRAPIGPLVLDAALGGACPSMLSAVPELAGAQP